MTIQTKNAALKEFLAATMGLKEVGLAIAKNATELSGFAKAMNEAGFKQVASCAQFLQYPKTYFVVHQNIDKDIYDFIVQYPTGQVQIFDKEDVRSQTFSPDYKNSATVLLVQKDNLNKIQEMGFDLLSATGLAYQS